MDRDNDGFFHADLGNVSPLLADCNDNNDDIYPGAFENCEDEVDSDCDGFKCPEQFRYDLTGLEPDIWGAAGDGLLARQPLADLDGDGAPELVLSAPTANEGNGRVYILPGPTASLSDAITIQGEIKDGCLQVGGVGDVDGDGADEVFLTTTNPYSPTTLVVDASGAVTATFLGIPQESQKLNELNELNEFALASGITVMGDPDGDGFNNMLMLAPLDADSGRAYLLSQPTTQDFDATTQTPRATFYGEAEANLFGGGTQTAPDLDGDGIQDALLTAPGFNLVEADGEVILEEIGAVYGFSGDRTGDINAADADFILYGSYAESHIEWAADLGDTNGDGYTDLGVFFHAGAGDLGIFTGPREGQTYSADGVLRLFGADGGIPTEKFGYGTIGNVDVDGDGKSDIMLGAPSEGGLNPENGVVSSGAAYFYLGPISGVSSPEHSRGRWLGGLEEGHLGTPVMADINRDGSIDLLLSAPGASLNGAEEGGIYILYDAFEEML